MSLPRMVWVRVLRVGIVKEDRCTRPRPSGLKVGENSLQTGRAGRSISCDDAREALYERIVSDLRDGDRSR